MVIWGLAVSELTVKKHEKSFWDDEIALSLDYHGSFTDIYTCQNSANIK